MLYPESSIAGEITKDLLTSFIVPAIKKYREERNNSIQNLQSTYHASNNNNDNNDDIESLHDYAYVNERVVMTLDGELPQIDCVMDTLVATSFEDNMEYFKFAAACSSSQQPNDKMRSFKIAKMCEKSMRYDINISKPSWLPFVENTLKDEGLLQPASRKSFLNFLHHLPSILSRAYVMKTVEDGWRKTGLFPYDPVVMLSHCPKYHDLNQVTSIRLINAIKELAVEAREYGELTENVMESKLEDIIGKPSDYSITPEEVRNAHNRSTRKSLNDKPINYGRCVWLNNHKFLEHQREIREQKAMKVEELLSIKHHKFQQTEAKRLAAEQKYNDTIAKKAACEAKKLEKKEEQLRKQQERQTMKDNKEPKKRTLLAPENTAKGKKKRKVDQF